ncbi:hypothetical protein GWK47_039912 [Chionoecetes opilio]|uniref:Uncharacterized protein n=1 Tax=Chionoecetes opilio TaxID=41210 RepID=A0A8J5CLF0_CHIOP|nr:hypothetical protein GWK47_039912 [Chionoecetes opilio]
MAGIELVAAKKVEKQVERGTRLKRLREREDSDIARLTERAEIPSQSSSSSSSPCVDDVITGSGIPKGQRKKLKQSPSISVKDLNLISIWGSREGCLSRQATSTFAAPGFQVLGNGIGSMAVSKSTVHQARIAGREKAAEKIVELRNQEIPERLVLLWGRKTPPVPLWRTEDRIPVLLTGER